jgi:DNA replication protein DnaC
MTTQKTGSVEIKKVLEQQFPQTKEDQRVSFEPEIEAIELTEDETEMAIYMAKRTKYSYIKYREWQEKISKEREIPKFSASEFYQFVINKSQKAITGFKLTNDEKHIYKAVAMYFTSDIRFESEYGYELKKGLLLYGNVGCGKTTLMKMFMDNPLESFAVIPCRRISADFQKEGVAGIEKYYGYLNPGVKMTFGHQDLGMCFDDLGTENGAKNYGNEANVMSEIILSRYESKHPSHITTNLSMDQIEEFYGERVRSRMREMFNLIEFPLNIEDKRR